MRLAEIESQSNSGVSWALDPRLPLWASRAAVQLDNLINKKSSDLSAVAHLLQLLKEDLSSGVSSGWSDPSDEAVFYQAFQKTHPDDHLESLGDVRAAARKIMLQLEVASKSTFDTNLLEKLRDFCIALSRFSQSYGKELMGGEQTHPYRKVWCWR